MLRIFKLILRGLKDTFLISYYKFRGKLDFPTSILPRIFYKKSIEFDSLLKDHKIYLLRRSDLTHDDTFNSLGLLRDDAIEINRVPYMSLNLLGSHFKPEHSKYRINKDASSQWINNEPIFLSEYFSFIEKLPDSCNIFFDANNIHNQSIPYTVPKNTPGIFKEIENYYNKMPKLFENEDGNGYELISRTKIVHDPIKLNYWHVEYNIENFRQIPFPRNKLNAYRSELFRKIYINILIANSSCELNLSSTLPSKYYSRLKL